MTVDRQARDKYAELLRHFLGGRVTNFEYEDRFDAILQNGLGDKAVDQLYSEMWYCYCDLREHRLVDKDVLGDESRAVAMRFILFLHSDAPYEWPTQGLGGCLLNFVTLGFYGKQKRPNPAEVAGDSDVWPFYRKQDHDSALANPRLLGGAR